jgi:hypothetical protein
LATNCRCESQERWRRPSSSSRGLGSAYEGSDASDQLSQGERFGQVVVGAECKALHSVLDVAGGGEHEDPGRVRVLDQLGAQLVAVEAGEVPVEDHDVVDAE